ncbi:MAG: ABC transporter permease [Acidobacteriota bacterium]|nr:ABC transporter permease [Acidobacteriota bacterium]
MRGLKQLAAVTMLNLRTIPQRLGSSTVAVIGIAGVVIVFVAVLSIAEGFRKTMAGTGSPSKAMIMRAGADTELSSILMRDSVDIIKQAPGIAPGSTGPMASAELFVIVDLPKKSTGTAANVPIRGVQPEAVATRDALRIVEGRMFEFGRNEVIVGRGAQGQFAGLEVGSRIATGQNAFEVVGAFEAGGSVSESEVWVDASVLQSAYRRGTSYQSVLVRLNSADAFDGFKNALTSDPRLDVQVVRESEYYAEQSVMLSNLITTIGYLIAVLMGVGAVFGAINTMYNAVASRTREIATLRALGFGSLPVVASVIGESLALATAGGLIGGLVAYAAFNGYQTATMNFQTFSQVAFSFAVTPALLVQGLLFALVMGFIGGLFPAIRAARLPIVTALREL